MATQDYTADGDEITPAPRTLPEGFLRGMDLSRYSFMFWSTVHGAVSLTLQNREMDQPAKWDATRKAVDTLMEIIAATRNGTRGTS